MMYKKQGIIARPRYNADEVVSAEMLKQSMFYHESIPLIVGPHPEGGYAHPSQYVGKVIPKWNDKHQVMEGTFLFVNEGWHNVPTEIKRKLANNEEIRLSAGYKRKLDKDKKQKWRRWDHLALGVRNPLFKDIGVSMRMEETLPDGFVLEEEPVITGDKPTESVTMTPDQLQKMIGDAVTQALEKQKETPAPVEDSKEAEKETETVPEPEKARPDPVPEEVLPASAPDSTSDDMEGIEVLDDGWWKF